MMHNGVLYDPVKVLFLGKIRFFICGLKCFQLIRLQYYLIINISRRNQLIPLIFLHGFVIKWSYHLRLLLLVECGQFCPPSCPTTKPYVQFDCRIHWLSISQERVRWCRSFSGCFLDIYPRKIASETTFFGWVWPGVLLIQSNRRILWLSMSLDGINWYLRFFTFR